MTERQGWPVTDALAFLEGQWRLTRLGWDALLAQAVRFDGTATFARDGDGLAYEERGALRFGAFRGEASRRYHYEQGADGRLVVRFDTGAPFHDLDLGPGQARFVHHCAPDFYEGRARVIGPDRWLLGWRIMGPRKRLVLVNRFDRAR